MFLKKYCKIANFISIFCAKICVIIFLLLLATIIYEVVARYWFNSPTMWSVEVSQYLFGITFLLAGGYTLANKGHVRVDILILIFSKQSRRILGIICYFISIGYLLVLLYITVPRAWESIYYKEVMDSVWAPYTWPILIFVPIGVFVMILQAVAMIIETWQKHTAEGGNYGS